MKDRNSAKQFVKITLHYKPGSSRSFHSKRDGMPCISGNLISRAKRSDTKESGVFLHRQR
jgi:hypothetical protein